MKLRAGWVVGWGFLMISVVGCGHDKSAIRGRSLQDADVSDGSRVVSDGGTGGPRDADVTTPIDASSSEHAIEFGRTAWGSDVAVRGDAPDHGTLFSVWTKVMDAPPSSYPYVRGNMDVYVLFGPGWHMRCLTGNMEISSASDAIYNANSMLFAGPSATWVDDYTLYRDQTPAGPSSALGWVWAAWQIVVESDRFVIRQWLKYGLDGDVFLSAESYPTFAEIRATLVAQRGWTQQAADAWVPGDAANFEVGRDRGWLVQARMMALASAPSLATLDGWAIATSGDGTAWGDYRLGWIDGAADLADRSGHGRDLAIKAGGTLYEGPAAPAF